MPDWNGAHRAVAGRHRAQGLTGPVRRYALIVLTLAMTSSLPILAAFGSGPAGVDRSTYAAAGTTPFIAPPSTGPVVVVPLQPGVAAGNNLPLPVAPAPAAPVPPRPGPPVETRPAVVPGGPPRTDPEPTEVATATASAPAAAPVPHGAQPRGTGPRGTEPRGTGPRNGQPTVEETPAAPKPKPVRLRHQVSRPTIQPSWAATVAGDVRERVVIKLPKPNINPEPVEASWELLGQRVREEMESRR